MTIAREFSRRMGRIALLVGVAFGTVPPLLYGFASYDSLSSQAHTYAEGLARPLSRLASRQPGLWRYNLPKVLQATAGHRGVTDIGGVQIVGCDGAMLLDGTRLGLGTGKGGGPRGRAPVQAAKATVAWVVVQSDPSDAWSWGAWLTAASFAMGALIGAGLWAFPSAAVRRQAEALRATLEQLASAEAELRVSNVDLQRRVSEAVAQSRGLSDRIVHTQERERQRIARDLHDGVGQVLTALQIDLEMAQNEALPRVLPRLAEARRLVEDLLVEIRRVVRDLRPIELESRGLSDALGEFCERFEMRTRIATTFRFTGRAVSDPDQALLLFRVVQEALTNVSRHAGAEEVGVVVESHPDRVELDIADDGRGFDLAAVESEGAGSGLRGMAERVRFAGGTWTVVSSAEQGTRLRAILPAASGSRAT